MRSALKTLYPDSPECMVVLFDLRLPGIAERLHRERAAWQRLTTDELRWLTEPSDKAQSLVPCPHVEMVSCGCKSDRRGRRGFEAHPELEERFVHRWNTLLERAGEIMGREVWRRTEQ